MPGKSAGIEEMEQYVNDRFNSFKRSARAYRKAAPWTSDYGQKFGNMRGFLKAVIARSPKLDIVDMKTSGEESMSEGTAANGQYLVPTEFSYEIIRLLNEAPGIRQYARIFPMSTWKRTLPRQLTQVAVAWVAEFGTKSVTKFTTEQMTQTAKVMAAIVKASDELLRDTAINLQTFLAELIAEAFGMEEERVGLVGDVSGAGDPFNGVYYATGVVEATMAGESLVYDDLIDMEFGIAQPYRQGAVFVLGDVALKATMKLKDKNGQFIWHRPIEGNPGQILNRPYFHSGQLPTTLGDAGDEEPLLLGNFGKYLWLSDREGIALKLSQDASDWGSGALESAFMSDQTWMRWTKAMSIDVALGAAFSKMLVK